MEVAETSHVKKRGYKERRAKLVHMNIPIGKRRGKLVLSLVKSSSSSLGFYYLSQAI